MILYATLTSERASKSQGGNEYVIAHFSVNRKVVGMVELYLYDDDKQHGCNENEWLLKWRKGGDEDGDWDILAQGHIPAKGKKQKGKCPHGVPYADDSCTNCLAD